MAEFDCDTEGCDGLFQDDDEQEFVFESGIPSFARRLTRRQKVSRGAVALLVVASAVFVLLGGPAATISLLVSPRQPIAAAAQIPIAHVNQLVPVRLPPGAATIATLHVSPAAGGAGGAYACWVAPSVSMVGARGLGPLRVTVLDARSQPWRGVSPPVPRVARCGIVADTVNPRQALLSAYTRTDQDAACSLPELYFTGDGGSTWQPVPWPDAHRHVCSVRVTLVDGRIYATSADSLLSSGGQASSATGRLIVSADRGRSWHAGDGSFGATASVALAGIRTGGRLLAETHDPRKPGVSMLWESRDDGLAWQSLGVLPGANAQVYISQNPADTATGGWGRLYLAAQSLTNGTTEGSSHTFFAAAYPGSAWSVLPSLPVAPVLDGSESRDIIDGGVGPGGLLYVTRAMAGSDDHVFTPQRAVWIWDPRQSQWLLSPVELPANTLLQGISWSRAAMDLWITIIHQGIPPTVQIAEFMLTPQTRRP